MKIQGHYRSRPKTIQGNNEDSKLLPHAQRTVHASTAELCCVYGDAYGRGMSVSRRQRREEQNWSAKASSLSALPPADSHPSAISFTVHHLCLLCENITPSTNRKYSTLHLSSEEDLFTVIQKISKITKLCGFWNREQTDIQTRWSQYFAPLPVQDHRKKYNGLPFLHMATTKTRD